MALRRHDSQEPPAPPAPQHIDLSQTSTSHNTQLRHDQSSVAPGHDFQALQSGPPLSQPIWWDDDVNFGLSGQLADYSTFALPHWPDSSGQDETISWGLIADHLHSEGAYLDHGQGDSQTSLVPSAATYTGQTGYGLFPATNPPSSAVDSFYPFASAVESFYMANNPQGDDQTLLDIPPLEPNQAGVPTSNSSLLYRAGVHDAFSIAGSSTQVAQPAADRTAVTNEDAPEEVEGTLPTTPEPLNGSRTLDSRDTSPTVQRLVAIVKQQQKTIDLLLQEVTKQPRRDQRTAEPRQSSRINTAPAAHSSALSTSGAIIKTRPKRRALAPVERVTTAETREIAACIRCQRVKKRCRAGANPEEPCLDCLAVNPLSLRIPCIRSRVTDAILFRTMTSEKDTWTVRPEVYKLSDLSAIAPSPLKMLELTHDLGHTICVYVKEFTPVDGDTTAYEHHLEDGSILKLEMPCYALAQLKDTQNALAQYVDKALQGYLECYLDDSDFLIWETFQLAIKRARWQDSALLQNTLRLWTASRLTERPWRICGEETLGMSTVDDPRSHLCGRIPVTPIMDTQLDQVVIQSITIPLRQRVLKMLQERISKKSRRDWFEVYATIFILLNSVEIAVAHDHEFAQDYGHYTPGRGNRFEDYRLVEGYFHSAQSLIAHFRDALHGQKPFTLDWSSCDFSSLTEVNAEETRYLQALGQHLSQKKATYALLKEEHRYESLLYWGHQLFSDTWDPKQVMIRELTQ